MNKSHFKLLAKLCSVHTCKTVFEIVVHRNVDQLDTVIGMIYLGADINTSTDSGRILAIHSYAYIIA